MTQFLETDDGQRLEAAWTEAEEPHAALVLCHPHPQHGGTMNAPLIAALARHLSKEGWSVLRFNFRGIGGSSGEWGGGDAELADVAAAMAAARLRELPVHLAGWSFGAATALRWQAAETDAAPYVGIAPPVASDLTPRLPDPASLPEAPRTLILGDRDQFTPVDDLAAYAGSIGARLEVLKGSDHFFHFRDMRVAELVAEALR